MQEAKGNRTFTILNLDTQIYVQLLITCYFLK
jgi:hypothetical protein